MTENIESKIQEQIKKIEEAHAEEKQKENTGASSGPETSNSVKDSVIEVLKTVYDPEIPVDIYELGLIYEIDVDSNKNVNIKMTLTSPACPVAGSLPGEVENKIKEIDSVNDAKVELTWEPPWDKEKMSEAARLKLNMF